MSMSRIIAQEARLRILQALARQDGGALNSELLRAELETWGINRTRDWVHDQLRWLADMGAITLTDASAAVRIATLTSKGEDHLSRARLIEGVKPPPRPEA